MITPVKNVELTFQVRHDDYQQIGGTTNPKIGLRWQPSENFLIAAREGAA